MTRRAAGGLWDTLPAHVHLPGVPDDDRGGVPPPVAQGPQRAQAKSWQTETPRWRRDTSPKRQRFGLVWFALVALTSAAAARAGPSAPRPPRAGRGRAR